ncbi:hypothetical protein MCUN1_003705 [Malassezia cuniculi]|uniref:J domain-containing protein n=1 Tax=Malassezia cuniculi TaxID=948313 RepID=A0AAF0EXF8_9BASI|nr:hypothetical protein MCUN1_003705 [Malassezia cuniculi]
MAAPDPSRLVLPSRLKEPYVAVPCPYTDCRTTVEYLTPSIDAVAALPPSTTTFSVQCAKCKRNFDPPGAPKLLRELRSKSEGRSSSKRRIGTDEHPIDMTYYDMLGVPADATLEQIKKSYRKLAIKLHPDKNPGNQEVEERFKSLATAYQVLSDPETRHKYNEFGASTPGLVSEDQMADPEEVLGSLFGGPRFRDIIGTISIGRDMKKELQKDDQNDDEDETPEAKAAREAAEAQQKKEQEQEREERVRELTEKLIKRLSVYTESISSASDPAHEAQVRESFRHITKIEADELRTESFGVELLHAVGFVYSARSRHYLAVNGLFGSIGGIYHTAASSFHTVRETFSTVRAALDLKSVFEELARAEEEGITEERKRELEEQAAEKGMLALFKGAKLELESVVREVTERVVSDETVSRTTQRLRAEALGIVGEVFMQTTPEKPSA